MMDFETNYTITYKAIDSSLPDISKDTYERGIKRICTIKSVNNLAYFLNHLKPFDKISNEFYINVFKEGINPVWEDVQNKDGCNWSVMLKIEVCQRFFERMLVDMCNGFFKSFEPNGIVGILKDDRFKLSIWAKNVPSDECYPAVIEELKSSLQVEKNVNFNFKIHSALLSSDPPKKFEQKKK